MDLSESVVLPQVRGATIRNESPCLLLRSICIMLQDRCRGSLETPDGHPFAWQLKCWLREEHRLFSALDLSLGVVACESHHRPRPTLVRTSGPASHGLSSASFPGHTQNAIITSLKLPEDRRNAPFLSALSMSCVELLAGRGCRLNTLSAIREQRAGTMSSRL